jgi:hypothetical protein
MFNTYLGKPYSCILAPQALRLAIEDDVVIEEVMILNG